MNGMLKTVAMFAMLGMIVPAQAAGDAQAGKAKTATCAGCHGPNGQGIGKNPVLAGKSETEIVQALNDYKSGKRANPVMKTFASQLSEQDMSNVADYYASQKPK